jgi:hypothetical protein
MDKGIDWKLHAHLAYKDGSTNSRVEVFMINVDDNQETSGSLDFNVIVAWDDLSLICAGVNTSTQNDSTCIYLVTPNISAGEVGVGSGIKSESIES